MGSNSYKVTNLASGQGALISRGLTAAAAAGSGQILVSDGTTEVDAIEIVVNGGTVTDSGGGIALVSFGGSASDAPVTATIGSSYTIDAGAADVYDITLTANTTLTITGALGVGVLIQVLVILRQGGSGSYTVTWPAAVVWRASNGTNTGSAPTLYTAVGAVDSILLMTEDGGTTWGGYLLPHDATGTVSSVGLSMPTEFSVSGSPVTSSGTLAVTKANESANTVWAGPTTGSAAAPTFRALVAADIPSGVGSVWAPLMVADTDGTHWNVVVDTDGNAIVVAE